jgi:RHS repeat-associated protein
LSLGAAQSQNEAPTPAAGIREPPETGPGWRDGEVQNAMSIDNRRGRDVHNRTFQRRTPRNANVDAGTGNGNYLLTIPRLDLPGRGLGVSLNLYYNSLLWQRTNSGTFVFDHDYDWPAPGWSLGYGKIYPAGSSGFIIQDADATRHLCVGSFDSSNVSFNGRTNDGTLLDCSVILSGNSENPLKSGRVSYPNGAVVDYETGDALGGALYPNRITDRNGNYISVAYYELSAAHALGPNIAYITDTLGRVINFNYDRNLLASSLTSISAPGIDGRPRTIVRFHYSPIRLICIPSGGFVRPEQSVYQGIDAIYFPGDGSGYWFDSHSEYGMMAKVSRRRAMSFTPGAQNNDQGSISAGVMTDERVYNYKMYNDPDGTFCGPALSDAPNYTTMTESWAGMTTPLAVTSYALRKDLLDQLLTTTYPDGTRHYVYTYTDTSKWNNGLVYHELTDGGTALVLSEVQTYYEPGAYNSPRVKEIEKTNALGKTVSTVYTYSIQNYNQVSMVKRYGYDNKPVSSTSIEATSYFGKHIFNLPVVVTELGADGSALAETDYGYDGQPLADTPGVAGHDPSYDKTAKVRGNVTQVIRNTSPGNMHAVGPTETRLYDITGNLVSSSHGTHYSTYSYTHTTDYGYVESITRGPPPTVMCAFGPCSISRSFAYDFNTGQMNSSTDENGQTTTFAYDPASLRRTMTTFPTGAFESIEYDDLNLKTTDTSFIPQAAPALPKIAAQTVTTRNGLGLPASVASLADGGGTNVVAMQYDPRGRLAQKSLPYRMGSQQPAWTSFTYDALGRETMRRTADADGSAYLTSYDEAAQPSSASGLPGETVRSTDPWGRERWYRLDALGHLAEVVEPAANGNGSVSAPGNMVTRYTHDVLGNLTQVVQGEQTRQFQYDPLGRLTAEYLPEKSHSLDASGRHVASGALWSDVFTYDDYSNLTSHIDARGVKTTYAYNNDPLDRLFEISYDVTGAWDPNNPIAASPNVLFKYMQAGDIRRPSAAYSPLGANPALCEQDYGYDGEGRLASRSSTCRAGQPLVVDYGYDPLGRITTRTYPVEYGRAGLARRIVTDTVGVGGAIDAVDIDKALVASQIKYDPTGPVASLVMAEGKPGATTDTLTYDPMTGRLSRQTVKRGDLDLLDLSYAYENAGSGVTGTTGQLTSLTDNLSAASTFTYAYDALGRLTRAGDQNYWSMTYGYDRYGNRTSVAVAGRAADGSVIPPDGLPSVAYDSATNHASNFSYDAAGNVTRSQRADGSWLRYRYDAAGRLASVLTDSGAVLESYSYSIDRQRLMTDRPGASGLRTYYAWDGDQVVAQYQPLTAGGDLVWARSTVYLGDRPLAVIAPEVSGNGAVYMHSDRLGLRLVTFDTAGPGIGQTVLPFGTFLAGGGRSGPVNPVFTSYDRSSATGLDYAVNRLYDSQTRFLQVDPLEMTAVSLRNPQSLNLFAYSGNDPNNRTDSIGLLPDGPIALINEDPKAPLVTESIRIPITNQDLKALLSTGIGAAAGGYTGGSEGAIVGGVAGFVVQKGTDTIDNAARHETPVVMTTIKYTGQFRESEPDLIVTTTSYGVGQNIDLSSGELRDWSQASITITSEHGSILVGDYHMTTTTIQAWDFEDFTSIVIITGPNQVIIRETNSDGSNRVTEINSDGSSKLTETDATGTSSSTSSGGAPGAGCGCAVRVYGAQQ